MSAPGAKMKIGEVHTLLREDFPDIELSKIRYYEDKGLVLPSRSRKGYRLYSERDVACLREAVRLAHEEFVPLRVVRVRLIEQGLLDDASPTRVTRQAARESSVSAVSVPVPVPDPVGVGTPSRPVFSVVPATSTEAKALPELHSSRSTLATNEFLTATGLAPRVVNQLLSMGFLVPERADNETVFSSLDVKVALAVKPLVERDVDLRLLGSLRRVVERELGIVDDLTSVIRQPGSAVVPEEVGRVARTVAVEIAELRGALYERALAHYER